MLPTKHIKVIVLLFVLSVSFFGHQNAYCTDDMSTLLFLSTSPIRAHVIIDGRVHHELTPLLIKDLSPGEFQVEIRKDGFPTHNITLNIEPGEKKSVHIDLENMSTLSAPSSETKIIFDEHHYTHNGESLNISQGEYFLKVNENELILDPVYPDQQTLTILNIAIPAFLVVSGLLTINDAMYTKDSGIFFSPATISLYTATAGMYGFKIVLKRKKSNYMHRMKSESIVSAKTSNNAEERYKKGQEMLAQENFSEALSYYTLIIQENKDSFYFPYALYKTAKIHAILGEYTLAAAEFRLVTEHYPLPDLYDRALKSIADLYYEHGQYQQSLLYLENMVYMDPLYSETEIDLYKKKIREKNQDKEHQLTEYTNMSFGEAELAKKEEEE